MVDALAPVNILLVKDNPGNIRLTQETFKEGKVRNNLFTVMNEVEAMSYLHKEGRYKMQYNQTSLCLI